MSKNQNQIKMEIALYLFNKIKDFMTNKGIEDSYKLIVLFSAFFIGFLLNDCIGITRYITNDLEFDQIERIVNLKKEYEESDEMHKFLECKENSITRHTPLATSFIRNVYKIYVALEIDTFPSALYVIAIITPFLLIAVFFIISIIVILFYDKSDILTKLASCVIGCIVIVADFFLWRGFKNMCDSVNMNIYFKSIIILILEISIFIAVNRHFKRNRKKLNENRTR